MKRRRVVGSLPAGYTIVEVIIVLAVTGALFVSVSFLMSGKQAATEFTQAVRDYESKIQSIASDVSSGYYDTGAYNCTAPVVGLQVNFNQIGSIAEPGSNQDCIFMGKMINTGEDEASIFTMVGRQYVGDRGSADVETIQQAMPKVFAHPTVISDTYSNRYGVKIKDVFALPGTAVEVSAFGFMAELGGGVTAVTEVTGSRGVLLYTMNGASPNNDPDATANSLNTTSNLTLAPDGIRVCFWDEGERRGEITIGANNSQTTTFVTIGKGVSPECL